MRISVRERTAEDSRPYLARHSRRGDMVTWRTTASAHKLSWVGRVVPNPPLGVERIERRWRCVRLSANGRLGTAVPTCEGGAFEGTRGHGDTGTRGVSEGRTPLPMLGGSGWRWEIQTRQLGQHAVLPLPSRQADASPTRPYLDTADAMSSYPYPASQPITDASSSPTARRQEGQTRVKGISGWRLAAGNTTEADPSCAR